MNRASKLAYRYSLADIEAFLKGGDSHADVAAAYGLTPAQLHGLLVRYRPHLVAGVEAPPKSPDKPRPNRHAEPEPRTLDDRLRALWLLVKEVPPWERGGDQRLGRA
jgi:hypothetical protein